MDQKCILGYDVVQSDHPSVNSSIPCPEEKISMPILNSLPFQGTFFPGSVLSPEMGFLDKIYKIQNRPIWDRVKPNHLDLTDWIWRKNLRFIGWLKLGKKSTGEWSKQRNIEIAKNGMYKREMVRSNHGRLYVTTTTTTTTRRRRRRRNHQQTQKLQPFYTLRHFVGPAALPKFHPSMRDNPTSWDCGCLSTSEKVTSRILGGWKLEMRNLTNLSKGVYPESTNRYKW